MQANYQYAQYFSSANGSACLYILRSDDDLLGRSHECCDVGCTQTGERLKGLVAGLVEGTLQLVADPLSAAVGCAGSPAAAPQEQQQQQQQQDCWDPVYQSRAGGYRGSSGISVQ